MTSFTVQYNLDKRSRQILPDGREEYPDDAEQWALFQEAEEARQAAAEAVTAAGIEDEDKDTTPLVAQRTPQPVIDKIFAARGELDVIFDLITAVKQQQFVSLSHVPTAKDPDAVAHQAALRLARRRDQLRSTAERIRAGTAAAREQAQRSDRFLQDLKEIRKEWRLCRRTTAQGGNTSGTFYVDLSLPIERDVGIFGIGSSCVEIETTHVNIVPSAEGVACIVDVDSSSDGSGAAASATTAAPQVKMIKGPQNLSEELNRRYIYHTWKVIETILSQEAKNSAAQQSFESRGSGSSAVTAAAGEALLRMAATATAKRAQLLSRYSTKNENGLGEQEEKDMAMVDAGGAATAEKGFAAQDIEIYCNTCATSQIEFEARALRCLALMCREAQTPMMVKQVRGGNGDVAGTRMLDVLTVWLRHAALCFAVEQSLTRQKTELISVSSVAVAASVVGAVPGVGERTSAKWLISKNPSSGGASIGTLTIECGTLRWYGPTLRGIAGQGQELGRAQLENFLENVLEYIER